MTTRVLRSTVTKTKKSSKKTELPHKIAQPICELVIKAHEQPHISLGNFTADHPPKGFSIHLHPDPEPDAIVAQVVRLGTEWSYELVLHIANYGNRAINARVWPLC